ncbi:MAG: histidinol-phosphate transaminase, partial [Myxococcales bacterium]|nr:histidinol-phosphate transaminase [Myxococcales bacterium]
KRGLEVLPSLTNFIMVRVPTGGAETVQQLMQLGVVVRDMNAYGFPDHVRVTIGLPEQNERFLAALDEVLAGGR